MGCNCNKVSPLIYLMRTVSVKCLELVPFFKDCSKNNCTQKSIYSSFVTESCLIKNVANFSFDFMLIFDEDQLVTDVCRHYFFLMWQLMIPHESGCVQTSCLCHFPSICCCNHAAAISCIDSQWQVTLCLHTGFSSPHLHCNDWEKEGDSG